jgi:hypothetical protein
MSIPSDCREKGLLLCCATIYLPICDGQLNSSASGKLVSYFPEHIHNKAREYVYDKIAP